MASEVGQAAWPAEQVCTETMTTTSSLAVSSIPSSVQQAVSFAFSLFCFFVSFCCSVYLLDFIVGLWALAVKKIKMRPYSPSFSRLERQLQSACASEDSEIWCLRHKKLSSYEFKSLVVP